MVRTEIGVFAPESRFSVEAAAQNSFERTASVTRLDVSAFVEDKSLGKRLRWILQLKGFNKSERLKRRINQVSLGQAGSSQERPISPGAVMVFDELPTSSFKLEASQAKKRFDLPDSRGMVIDKAETCFYVASVNMVYRLDLRNWQLEPLPLADDSWLAFIHSLCLSPNKQKILVASSGFDRIIEFNKNSGRKVREWVAWDHGYH